MKTVGHTHLPSGEHYLADWLRRSNQREHGMFVYQLRKVKMAVELCKQFRVAVDVGAHVGLWSLILADHFQKVEAFEPIAKHRECFEANVRAAHVTLHPFALSNMNQMLEFETQPHHSMVTAPRRTHRSRAPGGVPAGSCEAIRLDDLEFDQVDLIKLDCEGFEYFALQGAEKLLKRCKPAVVVEQKPDNGRKYGIKDQQAVSYLEQLGARVHAVSHGDYFMTWDA